METTQIGDWELLLVSETDESAFTRLFTKHRDTIYRIACSITLDTTQAEDIVQEVFMRLYRKKRYWKPSSTKFTTLLFRITYLVSLKATRHKKKHIPLEHSDDLASPESLVSDASHDLERMLTLLSPHQRAVIILRLFEGLSTAETAHVLGCREGTVKSHLFRAVQTLRRIWGETCA